MEKTAKNMEIIYDLVGFKDKKPVMRANKSDAPKTSIETKSTQNVNKAIGKFVILKNQHIKKMCSPVNIQTLKKIPASEVMSKINAKNVKNIVALSKLVTQIEPHHVVLQSDQKLLRTYSKKPDKSYHGSVNTDNTVADKKQQIGAGTLPVSNADSEGVSASRSLPHVELNSAGGQLVDGKTSEDIKHDSKVCKSVEEVRKKEDTVEVSINGEPSKLQETPPKQLDLEENPQSDSEMGKIKHFKEKTQQQVESDNTPTSIGKKIFEQDERMDTTDQNTEIHQSNPTQNKPKKRLKSKTSAKTDMIRREVEKCLKVQMMRKKRRKRVLESKQKTISCQTVESRTQTCDTSTQTDADADDNLDILQLDDIIHNMNGVLNKDVSLGTGPTMSGIFLQGKNMTNLSSGNTPSHQSAALQDYYSQFSVASSPASMCFDHLLGNAGSQGSGIVENNTKLMFYNYLKKCDLADAGGNIPLHIAVMASDIAEVRRQCLALKLRKKSVDVQNATGLTPLHVAVLNGCPIDLIEVLLQQGADPLFTDNDGNTSLHLAVMCRTQPVLVHLLQKVRAAGKSVDVFNYEGFTPLMLSVLEDNYALVHDCVEHGADPDTRDQKSGRTSLFHAVENNNEDMVKLFIVHGANTKIKNFFGTSTHDATFELENIKPEIKNWVVGKDVCTNKVTKEKKAKKKPATTGEKLPDMKNKLKTVRVLKIIKVNGKTS